MQYGQEILSWQAYDRMIFPKSMRWYIVAGVIALMFVLYGIFFDAITMSISFLVLGGVYFLVQRGDPKVCEYAITTLGIRIHDEFYPYSLIDAFYIIYEPPYVMTLTIVVSHKFMKEQEIFLSTKIDPADLRDILIHRGLKEIQGKRESLVNALVRVFRL